MSDSAFGKADRTALACGLTPICACRVIYNR
jgi:hypothetical protein